MVNKLYRSRKDKKLCGVCGGLAKYLEIDPTILRVLWALLVVFGGSGLPVYIICALIIPNEPDDIVDAV